LFLQNQTLFYNELGLLKFSIFIDKTFCVAKFFVFLQRKLVFVMSEIIDKNIDKIKEICKKHNIITLFVFGSVLTEKFNNQSDIDFIVSFDKQKITDYFTNFFDFKYSLEDIFNRKVDLLEEKPIKNKYFKENIENSKQLIYGRQN